MDKQTEFVLRAIEERDVRFVRMWFTDVLGFLKSVAIAPAELEGAFSEGIGFDGSAIEGFARVYESDMVARPDPSTFQILPWRDANPATARDYQRHTHQFTPGKTFPGTGAFGPMLVTADEVGDYRDMPIETRLNGEIVQKATLADLIFPIPRIISYLSQFTPLSPGDVIATGTPGGVGDRREPPRYLKAGDLLEVEIGSLGILRNPVIAEEALL
jgi:hypothetical protein